jgi:hypothetical protein
MRMLSEVFFVSSKAEKIPAGPVPTMITSNFKGYPSKAQNNMWQVKYMLYGCFPVRYVYLQRTIQWFLPHTTSQVEGLFYEGIEPYKFSRHLIF